MPETINWSFSVGAVDGPRVSGSDAFEVDAYDKISVVLTAGDTGDTTVQVQPADTADKVSLLIIRSSVYDAGIEVTVNSNVNSNGETFPLDGPLVLIGIGPVSLLADTAPKTLSFTKPTGADVTVDILAGRDSTPPPPPPPPPTS